jgi:DNA replication and repair protein RecF
MQINELTVRDFRNLHHIEQTFDSGLNVIMGRNAQGKTNLLEAMYMLVTGRSFRTRNERELVPWDRADYVATIVRADVSTRTGRDRYLLSFNRTQKFISVNDVPIGRLGELVGRLNAVLFTPADLELVQGAPQQRRRFLDLCLSQTSRTTLQALQRYDQALRQRNMLLKVHAQRRNVAQELAPYAEELATMGALVMARRAAALAELSEAAAVFYEQIAGRNEQMELRYRPSVTAATANEVELREAIREALARSLGEDLGRGTTGMGPHRDDFVFYLGGKDARDFASQGQQRTCVLALKLAELAMLAKTRGEPPVLFLDDLMSELDAERRERLLECLPREAQTFLTTTDFEAVRTSHPGRVLRMENGALGS